MNADKAFVDTNIFVYLYSDTDEFKKRRAFSFMSQYDCKISTQVLNEFCHTCIRKLKAPIDGVRLSIEKICSLHDVAYISEDTIEQALRIHEKYRYSYYDSLIISSALELECQYLFSEDMADGQIIERELTIKNIFR